MKRTLSFWRDGDTALALAGTCLIAGTYGLVRLAYGLFLPDLSASLDLGSAAAGVISSGASIAYCVGALVAAAADRHPRSLVAAALLAGSLGALGMAVAPGVAEFVPAAVVGSAGAGLASPALVAVVARHVAARRRDRVQAVVNSGTGPGLVLAGLVALVVLPHWRWGFLIGAVFTVAAGCAVLALSHSTSQPATKATEGPGPIALIALRVPVTAAFLLGIASAAVWTYGRTEIGDAGVGHTGAILGWMGIGVGGTATVLTAGFLARLRPGGAWALTAAGVAVSTGLLAATGGHASLAVAACLLFGWAFVAATSALIAWAAQTLEHRAATGTSVLFVMLTAGQAAGSAGVGALGGLDSLSTGFVLAAVTAVLAASCGVASVVRVGPGRVAAARRSRPAT
ncbi:MFS transporter [Nocardioides mangrovicus]|uniref:MFS transporter n=1 Tax=Nocardioides mangrovicus TaxID=2478913 RepID=UPI001314D63E|nr:MFS transporter [Nocardioides mangrovicus]